MYSQNNEEHYILQYLANKPNGKFLDIGAYDGKTFSNTLKLVELGWSGVCIEPSPSVFPALKKLHENNDKIITANVAVSDKNGKLKFFDSGGDAISTFHVGHKIKWETGCGCKFTEIEVDTISVPQMFQTYGFDFDFINLDVEATNWHIFKQIPFSQLPNLKLICVEFDGNLNEIKAVSKQFGFSEVAKNGENLILYKDN